ncbi:MAG TPA: class II fructose-bisphosphate aldolase [Lachnospiraceae bacterium]|nr:class II fructose-bisphosphate aldolase [Lachnospiraceae bacterium]
MLVNLKELLLPAMEKKYAVGHFNAVTAEMARAIIEAAEEQKAPVILGIEESQLQLCPLDEFASFALVMAKKANIPVAVHFDHGLSAESCMEAVKLGFTSVNFDCSMDAFENNVERVSALTAEAHRMNVSVEAELGHIPDASEIGENGPTDYYTLPDQAAEYVSRTKVDALAIAAGTAHGAYKFKPKVDFERIRAISEATGIPLVLHGGSGLSDRDFTKAIAGGICKINIFTDINIACCQGVIQALNDGVSFMTEILPYEVHSVKVSAAEKIKLFKNQ